MKKILKFTALSAFLLMLAGGLLSCERQEIRGTDSAYTEIAGTWHVKAFNDYDGLRDVGLPPDFATYSKFSITIPASASGRITGNSFHQSFDFAFEIKESGQIITSCPLYAENVLMIQLKPGIDTETFATNSNLGIIPKEFVTAGVWLFKTDGAKSLDELIVILSQDVNVVAVQKNHRIFLRADSYSQPFMENICSTAKFDISNNELTFMDSEGNPLIIFIKR